MNEVTLEYPTIKSLKEILDKFPDDLHIHLIIDPPHPIEMDIKLRIRTKGMAWELKDAICMELRKMEVRSIGNCNE